LPYLQQQQQQEEGSWFSQQYESLKKKRLNIEPSKKVLPDPHPPPYGKPITIVISDEVLLVQEYQVSHHFLWSWVDSVKLCSLIVAAANVRWHADEEASWHRVLPRSARPRF